MHRLRMLLTRPLTWILPLIIISAVVSYQLTAAPVIVVTEAGVDQLFTHGDAATLPEVSQGAVTPFDEVLVVSAGEESAETVVTVLKAGHHLFYLGGEVYSVWSNAATPAELLQQLGVELGPWDEVYPQLQSHLAEKVPVRVIRVEVAQVTKEEPIPIPIEKHRENTMLEGTVKVIQEGKQGRILREYRVTYADGEERSRELVSEEITQQPVPEIVKVGTMPRNDYLASRGQEGTVLEGMASWYGDESGSYTASGEPFDPNQFTAAHRTLPFGTVVQVTYLRTGNTVNVRINDRGPALWTGKIIDLSRAAAEVIGLKPAGIGRVRVKILRLP